MHARLLTFALFAGSALAVQNWDNLAQRGLARRQGQSFVPGTNQGFGETCESAFGPGHLECAQSGICYNPDEGQICCDEGYPCPAGSFCIGGGRCCPEGLTAETCAEMYSSSSSTPSSTAEPEPTTSTPASYPVATQTTTVCESDKPYPTATDEPSSVYPTGGLPKPTPSYVPPPPFEDAANVHGVAAGSLALAAVFAVFNLL